MESTTKFENGSGPSCSKGRFSRRRFLFPLKIALLLLVKSGLVMMLWNLLVPETFHGPELHYLQAIELTALAKLLFGFGGGRPRHLHGPGGHRWRHLTAEQKEELRKRFQKE